MRIFIILISVVLVFYSCTPPLYIPNTTNNPSLTKKGEIESSFTIGTNGYDIQTAGAITDNIGIMLNGSYGNNTSDSSNSFNKHTFGELGVGYSTVISDSNATLKTILSVFTGWGIGKSSGEYNYTIGTNQQSNIASGKYQRAFVQPSIGISNKSFDFFFSTRFSYVNMSDLKTNDTGNNSKLRNNNIFYEPTLTIKGGSENIKFMGQAGISVNRISNNDVIFRQRPIIITLGLAFDLDLLKKRIE